MSPGLRRGDQHEVISRVNRSERIAQLFQVLIEQVEKYLLKKMYYFHCLVAKPEQLT